MNRDYRFDVVRAISCLFIVLTHILQGYNNEFAFWTNSAVCSFFMLSGVLLANSKVDNYSSWLKRRFRRILIPYYVVTIPMIIIYVFFSKIKLLTIVVLLTNMSGIFGALSGFGHLWFLTGIMFAYLITPVILKWQIARNNLNKFSNADYAKRSQSVFANLNI
ncbi:acyltransferase family protein [Pediococcus parvulus]|uniref:acyltransferase family protein n=1 Tax=Pediococcus parvulus TaxID=54062 RepID=UPI0035D0675B